MDQGDKKKVSFISQLFVISAKLAKLAPSVLYLISYCCSLAQNSSSDTSLDLLSGATDSCSHPIKLVRAHALLHLEEVA